MNHTHRIRVTADFRSTAKGLLDSILDERFEARPEIEVAFLLEFKSEVTPEQIRDCDAVITLHPRFTAGSFVGVERLAIIARWGVGCDMIDIPACTENDVLVAITPEAVRRPVAEGTLTLLLAITHHLLIKDKLVRAGRWSEKNRYPGVGLAGKVLGTIGLGNVGSELVSLLQPFGLERLLAFDPYVPAETAQQLGAERVELETLLNESDFVCVNCPLTPQTRHLIGEDQLRRMKPTAFLVNAARGPIIDQAALTRALQEKRIAGAGLDVFETEPLPTDDPLCRLDNVILSPHAIAWTDALVRGNGTGACDNILTLFRGQIPPHVVNREVVERPGFQRKLRTLRERSAGNTQ